MSYLRFAAMIVTSTVVMFALMYLNTFAWSHIAFSETRVYMAILMGAAMAVIMLGFMLGMYRDMKVNAAIFAGSVVVFALALFLARSQITVGQISYMRAMIPHHSIAIMTSGRAHIDDPRVRKLADEIIAAQEREIAEMFYLVKALSGDDGSAARNAEAGDRAPTGTLADALARPVLATLDPAPISGAEAQRALPGEAGCAFSYTQTSDPVLIAQAGGRGLMKLNGTLIPLEADTTGDNSGLARGVTLAADGVTMTVTPAPGDMPSSGAETGQWPADLVFELDEGLRVGYRGVYRCTS